MGAKAAAKAKAKKKVIGKSLVVFDVKPYSDETDLADIEAHVKGIEMTGLTWKAECKQVPIAFGIKKLQIGCVVVDDEVSVDDISEKIEANEDLVQSVDI